MPSLTTPPPSKKRRLPDSDAPEALAVLPSPQLWGKPAHHARWGGGEGKDIFFPGAHHHVGAEWGVPARKIVPLPSAKRARLADEERRRSTTTRLQSGGGVTTATTTRDGAGKQSRMCLAACHICHRRPTKKTAMDSFADCEGCGERACFVCIRECMGPPSREGDRQGDGDDQEVLSRSFCMDDAPEHRPEDEQRKDEEEGREDKGRDREDEGRKGWAGGHRGVVCSRCCVEMGPDGEIACLGCLSRMEGG